ncbi:MAG: DUF2244 domain-containing protein [Gammaproteobacteria bacterium]|nr:DUF2244 domain-containing protein [Gammaproteobacteria bacterium]NIR82200.1 DUF2244 domain-containing protein [Gammaproteobacteria bacterium]NIR90799.1 DUF2244 domain-containing protein [Gammaproteobacteria bacterium]NIU03350.1 DUF2244 domain-containing protein [Gammaproteobacteria bacterium]NIV50846.1 DUF2244 domain-containing protein [Gammaproteobacteria bacterium]
MVSTSFDTDDSCRVLIRPNRALTWSQVCTLYFAVVAALMLIAIAFALQGFWPVVPFAGLELVGLGAAFYVCALRGDVNEVVWVRSGTVAVEKGRRAPEQRWEFPRAWTRVSLLCPRVRWYPSRLRLGSHGRHVELASFLNEEERRHLAGHLHRTIAASRS